MTAEELLRDQPPHKRSELIRGRLMVREPAGARHGIVANEIAFQLTRFVKERNLGRVYAAETGFWIESDPDTVRAPDVAFISKEHLPDSEPSGFSKLAPDLAVEVLGTDDRPGPVLKKVADWLNTGSQLVWVINPARREARVYRADGSESHVADSGTLEGENLLPRFSCSLSDLWS